MNPEPTPRVEMLVEWEGQAIHHPGVLANESQVQHLSTVGDVVAIANWIAVTGLSGTNGNSTQEAIRRKVVEFLKDWRSRFGQAKLEEVKTQLITEMQKYRKDRKITDQELHKRIEQLFDEIKN